MKRIWFKSSSVRWIEEGKKTTTFRTNRKEGLYEVVRGSWFNPIPVGLTVQLTPTKKISFSEVIEKYYATEGDFKSPSEFIVWLKEQKLFDKYNDMDGWLHNIKIRS